MNKKDKSGKRKRWLVNLLITFLLIVGIGLIFNQQISHFLMAGKTNRYQISHYTANQLKKNTAADATFNFKQVQEVSFSDVMKAQMSAQKLPVIGGIAIPAVTINLPIFKGVGSTQLLYGAGTMKANQQMGKANYALASHHLYASFDRDSRLLFGPLTRAKAGINIYITDKKMIYQYKVDKVYTVTPDQVSIINDHAGVDEITLVTCSQPDTKRLIVHGRLTKKFEFAKAPSNVAKAFTKNYNQWGS